MNRSPDMNRADLAAEERLAAANARPDDPELAADWMLHQELRGLDAPELPARLRSRVMRAVRRPHRPAWWLGLAAAVVLGLAVVLFIEPQGTEPEPAAVADADLRELEIALASLELGARRTTAVTGRELAASFTTAQFDLDELPYASQFRRWIQPQTSSDN